MQPVNNEASMLDPASQRIRNHLSALIKDWENELELQEASEKERDGTVIGGLLPQVLEDLARLLDPKIQPNQINDSRLACYLKSGSVELSRCSFHKLLLEIRVLRRVVARELGRSFQSSAREVEVLHEFVDCLIEDLGSGFVQYHIIKEKMFVSILSHDLRNPLTSAKSSAELLARFPGRSEKYPELVNRIIENIDRADSMIQDLLDADRVRAGEKSHLKMDSVDMDQLVLKTLGDFSSIYGDRFVFEARGRVQGYWNSNGVRRALENLLTNAVKYGDPRTPIRVMIERTDHGVSLAVHNFGFPLSFEEQSQLFHAFRRARSAQTSGKEGWGLGLSLVQGVVEAHGGKVQVKSTPKTGTTFTLEFPLDSRSFMDPSKTTGLF